MILNEFKQLISPTDYNQVVRDFKSQAKLLLKEILLPPLGLLPFPELLLLPPLGRLPWRRVSFTRALASSLLAPSSTSNA